MGQTIVEKIAQKHMAEGPNRPLRQGDFLSIRPHRCMTHDNTSAVMSKFKGIGAKKVKDSRQMVYALDHDIQNQDESNLKNTSATPSTERSPSASEAGSTKLRLVRLSAVVTRRSRFRATRIHSAIEL